MASQSFGDPKVESFLDTVYNLIKDDALKKGTSRNEPVIEFKQPNELQALINFEIKSTPSDHQELLAEIKKILKYSIKSGHPHFHNMLYAGLDPYSQAGSWVTDAVNNNIHTYEVCPVFILMEKYIFQKLLAMVGFDTGDGLFCPGGSASNCLALHLARFKRCPQIKKEGQYNLPRLRCYISEDGHYSLKKAGSYLGFGENNIVPVKTDDIGRMCAQELEKKNTDVYFKKKQQHILFHFLKSFVPLFVMATSGSTVLGSFDPLPELREVCKRYKVWLHCDACLGAGTLLSKKYKYLLNGVENCNSLSWNFHKMSGVPMQCSVLLINDKELMQEANSCSADYLFQPDKHYDTTFDTGDKTVQCGRKVDVMKLWTMWKALGDDGMEARIDKAFDNSRYLLKKLNVTPGFRLVLPEFQCTNICFWYIPASLRGLTESPDWWKELHKVAPKLKARMVSAGTMMIGYQPLSSKGLVNFFRVVVHNPACDHSDMDFVISEMERLGRDL
ncbi:unnamed protein product [Lymnaea stagnalis]|uniref:Cysteine sulfinic acid decarboxylase n=1 Tax=Lymnaea stagnalis TaxID=6523 RepID=A0AAV2I8W0_LYMST